MSAAPSSLPPTPSDWVDLRGCFSGWALLKLGQLTRSLSPGDHLEVLGSDAQMARDLPMVAASLGLRLLNLGGGRGEYRFRLIKQTNPGPGEPQAPRPVATTITDNPKEKTMSQLLEQVPETSHVVDARGSACPGPLLEAKKAIGAVKVGEVLEVISNDPGTKGDIPVWATKVGHEYLGHALGDGCERIFVRRKK